MRWNYAWDLYRAGQVEPALTRWVEVATAYGSHLVGAAHVGAGAVEPGPEGRKRSPGSAPPCARNPPLWIDARNFASQLPDWKQEDRDTLAEVLGRLAGQSANLALTA